MLAIVAPEGRLRNVLLDLLEFYLVAIGIVFVLTGAWLLLEAAVEGRALFPRKSGRELWVTAADDAAKFWFSVVAYAVFTGVVTWSLREYFALVVSARKSPDTPFR
jgi:hypothetical protein